MRISHLFRYPVKGLSPEPLQSAQVAAGQGIPHDRRYGLLASQAGFDPANPAWLQKANFVMLMFYEKVAGLKTRFLDDENVLLVNTPDGQELKFMLDWPEDRQALEGFFQAFLPTHLSKPPRLVEAQGHMFTDKADKYLSLINLASLRELEKHWGESLDLRRFRANVYIDGAEPFSELDWVGKTVRLGAVVCRVDKRNGRCAATNVNPDTAERDRNIPGRLRAMFGHKDLGVYLTVMNGGLLQVNDLVSVEGVGMEVIPSAQTSPVSRQLICTACYYLFEPQALNTNWSKPADLPDDWRCPDCGSTPDKVIAAAMHSQ